MVKILAKAKLENGQFRVDVDVNGLRKEYFVVNLDSLKTQVREEVNRQNAIDQLDTGLIVGDFDFSDTPAPQPTQAEIDRQTFFADFNKYQRVMELVNLGLVPANNTKVVALKNKVINEFKPEYFNL